MNFKNRKRYLSTSGLCSPFDRSMMTISYLRPSSSSVVTSLQSHRRLQQPLTPSHKMSKVIKVFGHPGSTCTRRVLTTLEELGLKYEIVIIDLSKGEHKQPPFLARQPFGQIPALEDVDGTKVFESRAIIRYLVHAYPKDAEKIVPKANQDFANVEAWLNVESENFNPPTSTLVFEHFFKKWRGGEADAAVVAAQKAKLEGVLDVIEKHLAATKWEYIAGNHFTLADISYYPYTEYLVTKTPHADVINARPHVAAWWQRISSRDSWKKISAVGF